MSEVVSISNGKVEVHKAGESKKSYTLEEYIKLPQDPNRFDGHVVGGHFKKDEEGNRTHLYVVYIDNGGNYYHYETPLDPELYKAGRKDK